MRLDGARTAWPMRLSAGIVGGVAVAFVDNVWSRGEVSPIVIVFLLLLATSAAGAVWGGRGTVAALGAWACVPLAHLVKHSLGMPDTLHPNTYLSILYLAGLTLAVSAVGLGLGVLLHRALSAADE